MSLLPTTLVTDAELSDGMMNGFDCTGALVVSMRYIPDVHYFIGDRTSEKNVTTWRVSPGGARRIASIAAWNSYGPEDHPTWGNA